MSEVNASRKTVTVLFSDLVDSTSLAERLDPEALVRVLDRYFSEMRSIVEAHGGSVEKFIGDAVVGVFGVPVVHEDDAIRATRSAIAMQEAIAAFNGGHGLPQGVELRARIGINTGEVMVSSTGDSIALGHAMNMAARLQQSADPGEVLIGAQTHALVATGFDTEAVGPLEVKGSTDAIDAWRVTGLREISPLGWSGQVGFVGRERELAQILDAIGDARRSETCVAVTVLAPPGMGKSRLAAEVGDRLEPDSRFLVGRCVPYGEGITYAPLTQILEQLAATDGADAVTAAMGSENDADLVTSVITSTVAGASQSSPDETAWAFRRLFEALATQQPTVIVLDDLHWADPLFLDLVEYISTFSVGTPLTLFGLARPDLLDTRPGLLTPRPHSTLIRLEPLSAGEMAALVAATGPLDESARERIVEAAGGVPLFAEQMAAFEEEGHSDVPPTVRALLAARVDLLEAPDRRLLEIASIEGEVFTRTTVAELSADDARAKLGGRLISLVQRDFVRPERSSGGRDAFRFSHALVRDAVYGQMPRQARSGLHERYAEMLRNTGNGAALLDVIGHHLAAAHAEMFALGDEGKATELAVRAGGALQMAGVRAVARKQWHRGVDLLSRASDLLAEDPAAKLDMAPELIKAYVGLQDFKARDDVHETGSAEARRLGDRAAELRIEIAFTTSLATSSAPDSLDRTLRVSEAALEYFTPLNDDWNLAEAWILRATHAVNSLSERIDAYTHAQAHADRSENEFAQIVVWDELGYLLLIGETPFSQVREFMEREIAWAEERGIAFTAADGMLGTAYCLHAANELADARSTLARLHDIFGGLPGDVPQHGESYQLSAIVERDAGDPEAAARYFEHARELFAAIGNSTWWQGSTNGAAHAALDMGRLDDAEALLSEVEARGITGSVRNDASGIAARARLAAARGDHSRGTELILTALDSLVPATSPQTEGRLLEYLADIHELNGNTGDVRIALEKALERYVAKEFEVGRKRVTERLRTLP